MSKKASNPPPPKGLIKPPPPPPPPLGRYILSHDICGTKCPECGSSTKKKYVVVGRKKCIHPKCGKEF